MSVTVHVNERAIQGALDRLLDSQTMLQLHQYLAEKCDPYVPYKTGDLAKSGKEHVTSEAVTYTMDYAERQYFGVGIQHNLVHHPKATALWDEVMMQEQEEEFTKGVEDILNRRARELNGK